MQTPTQGRIVIVKGFQSNGQDEHPAIVNCVHSSAGDGWTPDPYFLCNLTMFPDFGAPQSVGSTYVFQDRAQAVAYQERNRQDWTCSMYKPNVAFFPERG